MNCLQPVLLKSYHTYERQHKKDRSLTLLWYVFADQVQNEILPFDLLQYLTINIRRQLGILEVQGLKFVPYEKRISEFINFNQSFAYQFKLNNPMRTVESSQVQIKRYLPLKRELTPKINHTKTTIAKSAPYLIRKHHLDDSQMKRVLHYDDETLNRNYSRRYSYKGEVVSCQNSKISTKINPHATASNHKPKPINNQNEINDYYTKENNFEFKQKQSFRDQHHKNYQMPYFTNSGSKQARSNTNNANLEQNYNTQEYKLAKKTLKIAKQSQQYGLQQMHAARKKMEKQAKKLRKLHQKKVEVNIQEMQNSKVSKLQKEIKNLRIRNLQLQKQKFVGQLSQNIKEQQRIKQKKTVIDPQSIKINRAKLILNKPKYNSSAFHAEDTDSSFSSFELG